MRPVIPYRNNCIHERCPSSVNKSFPRKTTRFPGKKAPILVRQRPSFSSKSTGPIILLRSPHFQSIISRQDHSLALVHGRKKETAASHILFARVRVQPPQADAAASKAFHLDRGRGRGPLAPLRRRHSWQGAHR